MRDTDRGADLAQALRVVERFAEPGMLGNRIASVERKIKRMVAGDVEPFLEGEDVDSSVLRAAFRIKDAAGQINVLIHAVGILVSLPYILEAGEEVQYVSLGAGNTGRDFDLETDRRIAEFKFVQWRGGPESIRQNQLFGDLFKLLEDGSGRRRCLFVLDDEKPLRFLTGRRALRSVLSKNEAVRDRFRDRHGDKYTVVSDYFHDVKDLVEIIDLRRVVPVLSEE